MKKLCLIFSLIVTFGLLLSSCDDDDGYSLGDFWISMATVEPLNDNTYYLVINGKKMWPVNYTPYFRPTVRQRAYVNYTILSDQKDGYDHYIQINGIQGILTKYVIDLTEENQDSIGNDPVKIIRYWISDDYLNIEFSYNWGGRAQHYINMVNNTTLDNPNDGKVYIELRHNKNNDPELYAQNGLVAFDLRPYKETNSEAIDFVLKVRDFDTEKEHKFTYKLSSKESDGKDNIDLDDEDFDVTQYN